MFLLIPSSVEDELCCLVQAKAKVHELYRQTHSILRRYLEGDSLLLVSYQEIPTSIQNIGEVSDAGT